MNLEPEDEVDIAPKRVDRNQEQKFYGSFDVTKRMNSTGILLPLLLH